MLLKVRTNECDGGEEEETRSSPKIETEHSLLEILRCCVCWCRLLTWAFVASRGTLTKVSEHRTLSHYRSRVRRDLAGSTTLQGLRNGSLVFRSLLIALCVWCCVVLRTINHLEWADYLVKEAYYQREQEAQVGLTETQNPMKWETQAKGQNWFLTNMCCPMFEDIQQAVAGFDWVGNSKDIQRRWSELEQAASQPAEGTGDA
jgi:hypothetical protein